MSCLCSLFRSPQKTTVQITRAAETAFSLVVSLLCINYSDLRERPIQLQFSSVQSFDRLRRRWDMRGGQSEIFQSFFCRRPLCAVLAWAGMYTLVCCPSSTAQMAGSTFLTLPLKHSNSDQVRLSKNQHDLSTSQARSLVTNRRDLYHRRWPVLIAYCLYSNGTSIREPGAQQISYCCTCSELNVKTVKPNCILTPCRRCVTARLIPLSLDSAPSGRRSFITVMRRCTDSCCASKSPTLERLFDDACLASRSGPSFSQIH